MALKGRKFPIVLLILSLRMVVAQASLDSVSRPNYGVSFHPLKTLYPASSSWTHVFRVQIPDTVSRQLFRDIETTCTEQYCAEPNTLDRFLRRFQRQMVKDANLVRSAILDLTKHNLTQPGRKKRQAVASYVNWSTYGRYTQIYQAYSVNFRACMKEDGANIDPDSLSGTRIRMRCSRRAARASCEDDVQECIDEFEAKCPDPSCSTLMDEWGQGARRRREIERGLLDEVHDEPELLEESSSEDLMEVRSRLSRQLTKYNKYIELTMQVHERLGEVENIMQKYIPRIPMEGRVKRWNPIAWVGKHVFGLATGDDVDRLAKVVKFATDQQITAERRFTKFQQETASFMDVVSQRFTNVAGTISTLHTELQGQLQDLSSHVDDRLWKVMQFSISSSSVLASMIEKIQTLNPQIDHLMAAVNDLVQGKLSPYLVNHTVLTDTIGILQDQMRNSHPYFHLTELSPQYYYRYGRVNYFRTNSKSLMVSLDFPLSALTKDFRMYSIAIHNTPIVDDSSQTTRLKSSVEYFGVSDDRANYIEMTHKELARCDDTTAYRCTSSMKIFDMDKPSCMAAIFQDDSRKVKQLCGFRFESTEPIVDLVDVGGGHVLVHNAESIFLHCGAELPKQEDGCVYCQIELLCGCAIHISNGISAAALPPRINNCIPKDHDFTVIHPINLAALSHIYDIENLEEVNGETMYNEKWLPRLPKIKMSKEFEVNLNRDYDYSMKLDSVMKQAKRGLEVSPIKQIAESTWDLDSAEDFFTLSNVIGILSILVAMAAMALTIYLWRSYRILNKTINAYALTGLLPKAEGLEDLPNEFYRRILGHTPPAPTRSRFPMIDGIVVESPTQEVCIEDEHVGVLGVMALLAMASLLVIIGYLVYKMYAHRCRTRCKLYLELGNLVEYQDILIMKLPGAMSNYHLMGLGVPGPYQVRDYRCRSYLSAAWKGLIIGNRMGNTPMTLPSKLCLYPCEAAKVRRILQGRFTAVFKIEMARRYYIIPTICKPDCDGWSCKGVYKPDIEHPILYPEMNQSPRNAIENRNTPIRATAPPNGVPIYVNIGDGRVNSKTEVVRL